MVRATSRTSAAQVRRRSPRYPVRSVLLRAAGSASYLDLYNKQHAVPGTSNAAATGTPLRMTRSTSATTACIVESLQPAPYDGMYSFPSLNTLDPATGKPVARTARSALRTRIRAIRIAMARPCCRRPVRREVVVPPGYELVKEEDKNILIGDNYIAPATVQFRALVLDLHPSGPGFAECHLQLDQRAERYDRPRPHPQSRQHEGEPAVMSRSGPASVRCVRYRTSSVSTRSRARSHRSPCDAAAVRPKGSQPDRAVSALVKFYLSPRRTSRHTSRAHPR